MAHYVHDDNNNRVESLSKEEIYALIDEVIAEGELPTDEQEAFVTQLKSIVDGNAYKIGFCTQTEYNNLEAQGLLEADALYIITDDTTESDLEDSIDDLDERVTTLEADRTHTHYINWTFSGGAVSFTIINHDSTPITPANIFNYITTSVFLSCSGYVTITGSTYTHYPLYSLYLNKTSNNFTISNLYFDTGSIGSNVLTASTITSYVDTVL